MAVLFRETAGCGWSGTDHGNSRFGPVFHPTGMSDSDERQQGEGEFGSKRLKKVREPLYCGHIAGFGGTGASDAVPGFLSSNKDAA